MAHCMTNRGTRSVGVDEYVDPNPTELSRPLNRSSFRNCPLASPEGKLAWQIIGTSEPIIYHD